MVMPTGGNSGEGRAGRGGLCRKDHLQPPAQSHRRPTGLPPLFGRGRRMNRAHDRGHSQVCFLRGIPEENISGEKRHRVLR